MRYQVQWFPRDDAKYNEKTFLQAVQNQPDARDVEIVPYINRYNPATKVAHPTAMEFTVTGGYPNAQIVLFGINKYLMKKLHTSDPQGISIRSVSTIERKRKTNKMKIKRKTSQRCNCK